MKIFSVIAVTLISFLISISATAKKSLFSETLCDDPRFFCVTVQKGDTWESLLPDEDERNALRRINRMNIRLRPGMRIATLNKNKKIKLQKYSPFPSRRKDITEKTLIFDPIQLAWVAYDENGTLLNWGPASGGNDWCPDVGRNCQTPAGEFRVLNKSGAGCRSRKYPLPRGGAKMPYCVFFARGYAFHGSPEVPGYNASHGCVRLFDEDAKWINEEFIELPMPDSESLGTRVIILSY